MPTGLQTRLRDAQLPWHDGQNFLTQVINTEMYEAVPRGIALQLQHRVAYIGIRKAVDTFVAARGRHVMIAKCKRLPGTRKCRQVPVDFTAAERSWSMTWVFTDSKN